MRLKAIADHNRVCRLEDWNGLDLAGNNDCASILNAAMTQAAADGMSVSGPCTPVGGGLLVGTTVNYAAPLIGPSWGLNSGQCLTLKAGMTDGTPILEVMNIDGWHVENVRLQGTQRSAGTGYVAQHATGIKLGEIGFASGIVEDYASTRGTMRNVIAYGLRIGLSAQGWQNTFYNVFARYCDTGALFDYQNGSNGEFCFDACGIGFKVTSSRVFVISKLIDQANAAYRTGASLIDTSDAVTINGYCTEGSAAAWPWLKVGSLSSASPCVDFAINSGLVGAPLSGVYPIELDYVEQFSIRPRFKSVTTLRGYSTTANSRRDISGAPTQDYGSPFTTLSAALKTVALDLLVNPYMDGMRWGCSNALIGGTTRASLSEETSNIRTGANALRVTATTGQHSNYASLEFTDPWVSSINGQALTLGAWVYVPPSLNMGTNETPATYIPRVSLASDGTGGTSAHSTTDRISGGWSFMHALLSSVPSDATKITITLRVNNTTTPAAGGEYIIVDEMHLAVGDCWEDMFEGRVQPSPLAVGSINGGRLAARVTQAAAATMIADTNQIFKTGDTLEYTDPVLGGVKGLVCTTAGAGGAAVFRDFGVIA